MLARRAGEVIAREHAPQIGSVFGADVPLAQCPGLRELAEDMGNVPGVVPVREMDFQDRIGIDDGLLRPGGEERRILLPPLIRVAGRGAGVDDRAVDEVLAQLPDAGRIGRKVVAQLTFQKHRDSWSRHLGADEAFEVGGVENFVIVPLGNEVPDCALKATVSDGAECRPGRCDFYHVSWSRRKFVSFPVVNDDEFSPVSGVGLLVEPLDGIR